MIELLKRIRARLFGSAVPVVEPAPALVPEQKRRGRPKGSSPTTAERNRQMVEYFDGGRKTLQQVGDQFGVTREYVRQVLVKNGVLVRNFGKTPPEVLKARVDQYSLALQPGVTTKEACSYARVSYWEVQAAAKALGIKLPRPVRSARKRYHEIADFYVAHPEMTGRAVAAHFNCSPMYVSNALKKTGVLSRHDGWKQSRSLNGTAT